MTTITYLKGKQLKVIELDEIEHKAWRKFKRTLAITEPCKEVKIKEFKVYLKRHTSKTFSTVG